MPVRHLTSLIRRGELDARAKQGWEITQTTIGGAAA